MQPDLKFLKNFKNPCWLEKLTTDSPYAGKQYSFVRPSLHFDIDPKGSYKKKMRDRLDKGDFRSS